MRTKSLLSSTWILTCGIAGLAAVVWFSLPAAKVSAQLSPCPTCCPTTPQNVCTGCCNDNYEMCHMVASNNHEDCLDMCIAGMGTSSCRKSCDSTYKGDQVNCVDDHKSCLSGC